MSWNKKVSYVTCWLVPSLLVAPNLASYDCVTLIALTLLFGRNTDEITNANFFTLFLFISNLEPIHFTIFTEILSSNFKTIGNFSPKFSQPLNNLHYFLYKTPLPL